MRALVIGLGPAGEPAVRQLAAHGYEVVVLEDFPTDASRDRARRLAVDLATDVDPATLTAGVELVVPSPAVKPTHPAIAAALADGVPVWSEFELFVEWDDRPAVAITGTNGKTTVTTLVELMLQEAGVRAVACGNNDLPLIDAIDDHSIEVFVVEASSFRLAFTERFHPMVGTWLNLSPDHLDWHPDYEHYAASKAKIWAAQRANDLAVANAEDGEVLRRLAVAPARKQTFGIETGDLRVERGVLVCPTGAIVPVEELPKRLPHDLANALAAAATAMGAGASADACAAVLRRFHGLPHRVELVGEAGGVRWYDDSKATTPASVAAAVSGFESVVLIAGGKNKGLDLSALRALSPRVRVVVAIGEAAPAVTSVFEGAVPVVAAGSMDHAVAQAAAHARPGDAVLLSPGCASYDWYRNYGERGDDFARAVKELVGS